MLFGVAGTLLAEALLPMAVAAVWAGPVLVALALGAALVGRQVALR